MQGLSPKLARSTLDAAPDAMIIIDEAGVIRFANRQVSALFGYPHEGLIGQTVEVLLPEQSRARHPRMRQSYMASVRRRPMGAGLNLFGRRQDGTEFPVEISLSPVDDDGRTLVAAAIRDVTERKRAEAELIAARQSAERAREAADQARTAADEARLMADRANQAKSRFLTTASHDLRQPLQTLSLLNGTLRRLAMDPLGEEAVAQQDQAITSMSRLLNALLDISKLESGAIKPDPTDFAVRALCEELRQEFAGLASNKGLAFEVASCEDSVHSDPSLVGQILRNLLSNAIKYTRVGHVALRCRPDRASRVRIEVLDTGVGIPAEQLRYIYDEFYQVGVPANVTRDGYGLGLSIVRRLVALLEVRLEVQSEVGKGSVFVLTLPAGHAVGRAEQRRPELRRRADRVQVRVLLVEDDPAVLSATHMLLKADGYDVMIAQTLSEALEQAQREPRIDLLVTDYHLGDGETGTQVISSIRSLLHRQLEAILMTGDTSSAVRDLPPDPCLRIVSKPVKADELLTMLREVADIALRSHRNEAEFVVGDVERKIGAAANPQE